MLIEKSLDKNRFCEIIIIIIIINKMKREIKRRSTKQKSIILEELAKVKTHPTADSVFRLTRRKLPSVSFGTVYRNLNLLRDEGKIMELSAGRYSCRYDAATANHYHFICLACGSLFDVDAEVLKDIDSKISKRSGMKVKYHRMKFYGYCLNCKDKERKERKNG